MSPLGSEATRSLPRKWRGSARETPDSCSEAWGPMLFSACLQTGCGFEPLKLDTEPCPAQVRAGATGHLCSSRGRSNRVLHSILFCSRFCIWFCSRFSPQSFVSLKGSSSLPPADLIQDSRAHGCYRIIVGSRPGSAGEAPSRLTHNEEGDSGCNFLPGFNSWVVISPGCSPHLVPPPILDTPCTWEGFRILGVFSFDI